MLLAISIGNTHVSLGLVDQQKQVVKHWRLPTHAPETAAQLVCELTKPSTTSAAIASVVPSLTNSLTERLQAETKQCTRSITFLDHTAPFIFENQTKIPKQVGLDRLLAAEACCHLFGAPVIIVDAGTATTLSVLDYCTSRGRALFLGGAIAAGLRTSLTALLEKTAQLPVIDLSPKTENSAPPSFIGRNTEEALFAGAVLGHARMIEGLIVQMQNELLSVSSAKLLAPVQTAALCPAILTGGMSQVLHPYCSFITHCDPLLILKGIAYVHERI